MRTSGLLTAVAVGVVLALGTAGAAIAGVYRHSGTEESAQLQFAASAQSTSAIVATQIRRASDLVTATGAFILASPSLTQPDFELWADATGWRREPALRDLSYVRRIPGGGSIAAEGGERCVLLVSTGFAALDPPPAVPAADLCAGLHLSPDAATESDALSIVSVEALRPPEGVPEDAPPIRGASFTMAKPVYVGSPRTAAERASSLDGWVVAFFDGSSLVRPSLQGPGAAMGLTLTWRGAGGPSTVARVPRGPAHQFERRMSITADGTWDLVVSSSSAGARSAARRQGWVAFAVVEIIACLFAALLGTAWTSRSRAVRLVERKTVELRYRALHDDLTGLPNRVLALDRADQVLARARRSGSAPIALFLDVDNFKTINDSFGHGAGDELLKEVARRLQSATREGETVARLGGDEFVVLADDAGVPAAPERLADRILLAMSEPFQLSAPTDAPLRISLSIGIACGDRREPGDLLRDADIALYEAKAAGKGRYASFKSDMQDDVRERLESEVLVELL